MVKVYGGLSTVYPEALDKLSSILLHPFPKVRNAVVEELFMLKGCGKGVNWVKAKKVDLDELRSRIGMVTH